MTPKRDGRFVDRRLALTPEIDAGLAEVAKQTGWSRNALARLVLTEWLGQIGLVSPTVSDKLKPTRYKQQEKTDD